MKKLRLYNGGDWEHRGGHLFVAAWSAKDAVELIHQARCKIMGRPYVPGQGWMSLHYFRTYFSHGCWGISMNGVTPERGVWWAKGVPGGMCGKPERIILEDQP